MCFEDKTFPKRKTFFLIINVSNLINVLLFHLGFNPKPSTFKSDKLFKK